jgi:hypothetical protein
VSPDYCVSCGISVVRAVEREEFFALLCGSKEPSSTEEKYARSSRKLFFILEDTRNGRAEKTRAICPTGCLYSRAGDIFFHSRNEARQPSVAAFRFNPRDCSLHNLRIIRPFPQIFLTFRVSSNSRRHEDNDGRSRDFQSSSPSHFSRQR